jgi:type I restriction enzyme, R subunit
MLIRNSYEPPGHSLRLDGRKVQGLIDEYVRSLNIEGVLDQREVTYNNFLGYAAKFKSDRARTALIKNKSRQIISELAPTNPVYYEKLRERLERIIEQEEKRRKDDATYFNEIAEVYNDAVNQDKERKKLGFSTQFEFAVFEELQALNNKEDGTVSSKEITKTIFDNIKQETNIVGWKTKKGSEKRISVSVYDILNKSSFPEDKINELIPRIIDLAKRSL